MKKEIKVWVHKDFAREFVFDDFKHANEQVFKYKTGDYSREATLIIELPDKKIEITESELREELYKADSLENLERIVCDLFGGREYE